MGTRNLIAVHSDGEYKLAQYCQWDGYPSGQGVDALGFCREHLQTEEGIARFKEKLELVEFPPEEKIDEFYASVGSTNGWMTMDQSREFNDKYPYFSRDHGARILHYVMAAPEMRPKQVMEKVGTFPMPTWQLVENDENLPVMTTHQLDFAGDSLFCEWAYVIDLDKRTFEAYSGFNKKSVPEGQRFAHLKGTSGHDGTKYHPVVLAAQWPLSELPSEKVFLSVLEPDEEE